MVNQMVTDNSRRRTAAAAATATATQMSTAPDAPKIRRVCTITKRGEPEPAAQSGGTPPRNHRLNRVRTSCFRTPKPKGPKGPSARAAVQTKCKSLSPSFSMAWRVAKASAARSGSSRGTGHDKTMPQKKNRVPCAKQLHKDAPRQIVISIGRRKTYNDDTFRNWSTSSRTPCERRHTQVI